MARELQVVPFANVTNAIQQITQAREIAPIDQIGRHLTAHGCGWAVLESGYEDRVDATKDDAARMHFYSGAAPELNHESDLWDHLWKYDCRNASAGANLDGYLGFAVLRKDSDKPIGPTILRVPPGNSPGFVHVRGRYPVRVGGIRLEVEGAPFAQSPDAQCAGATLWALARDRFNRGLSERLSFQTIVDVARGPRRSSVDKGMRREQMERVLDRLGCGAAHRFYADGPISPAEWARVFEFTYAYVQSDIPVLLGYWDAQRGNSGHVVLAIGHDLGEERPASESGTVRDFLNWPRDNSGFALQSDFVENFIVQNDGRGPYQVLPLWTTPSQGASNDPRCLTSRSRIWVAAAAPPEVKVAYPILARSPARSDFLEEMRRAIVPVETASFDLDGNLIEGKAPVAPTDDLRVRTYIQSAAAFKSGILRPDGRVLGPQLRQAYLTANLPRYLWVCEILEVSRFASHVLGEAIFDATDETNTRAIACRVEGALDIVSGKNATDPEYRERGHPRAPRLSGAAD